MKYRIVYSYISLLAAFLSICSLLQGKSISPYEFGLAEAKSGEERFWALYNVHVAALAQSAQVDYSNIGQLDIEIPAKAKSIPLGEQTDFRGLVLNVDNKSKDKFYLFTLVKTAKDIIVDKADLVSYNFTSYPELSTGIRMLIVQDTTPWVDTRKGFDYGATRKEVLLLKNGRAVNKTIQPYNNVQSAPTFRYVEESNNRKCFNNLTFIRTGESTKKTFLLKAQNLDGLEIRGVRIYTPENRFNWNADYVISVYDCSNLSIRDVRVEATYSLSDKFGYAFYLNNIWNVKVERMYGMSKWGVFGCNNINKATIKNSDLDRFDLHCYGRDYSFINSTIRGSLPVASMFGTVKFENCVFDTASPCLYRADYNAYTPFDLSFNRCTFMMDEKHNFIVYLTILTEDKNSRPELMQKCLPNISLRKCEIYLDKDMNNWDVIHIARNSYPEPLGYISSIAINGLKIHGPKAAMSILSRIKQDVLTENPVEIKLKNIKYTDIPDAPEFHLNFNRNAPTYNIVKPSRVELDLKLKND